MSDDIAASRISRPPLLRAHLQAFLVFLACNLVGCDDSNGPEPCSDPPGVISVSAGLKPSISWTAVCEAQVVMVYDAQTGLPVWHLTGDTRRIPNPVTYSVVPPGAKVLHTAEPLQPGMRYGVYVAVMVGTDTVARIGGGFTP